ncbi:uncharacterized protein B0J16DRAFT_320240 [Fusarium flagelliforme]|uniref:uncharacterized protein n=1 Tax=Fusarium flagelliforme TaxID=2675880 RepID=UPI001E8E8DDB|nr:uncharacterized protein B0J16DRAFT_320240 [Fusarium flagelliforme]KAH7185461.1 hypothetical protein B0J16DRAFT_320240 [Fusarium flagelliforme]
MSLQDPEVESKLASASPMVSFAFLGLMVGGMAEMIHCEVYRSTSRTTNRRYLLLRITLSIEPSVLLELDPETRIETELQTRCFQDKTTDAMRDMSWTVHFRGAGVQPKSNPRTCSIMLQHSKPRDIWPHGRVSVTTSV